MKAIPSLSLFWNELLSAILARRFSTGCSSGFAYPPGPQHVPGRQIQNIACSHVQQIWALSYENVWTVVGTRDLKNGSDSFLFSKSIKDQARTDKTDYNLKLSFRGYYKIWYSGIVLQAFEIFNFCRKPAHSPPQRRQTTAHQQHKDYWFKLTVNQSSRRVLHHHSNQS